MSRERKSVLGGKKSWKIQEQADGSYTRTINIGQNKFVERVVGNEILKSTVKKITLFQNFKRKEIDESGLTNKESKFKFFGIPLPYSRKVVFAGDASDGVTKQVTHSFFGIKMTGAPKRVETESKEYKVLVPPSFVKQKELRNS